nr:hypothetical protein [Tanacetum cinerariifolium]
VGIACPPDCARNAYHSGGSHAASSTGLATARHPMVPERSAAYRAVVLRACSRALRRSGSHQAARCTGRAALRSAVRRVPPGGGLP